MRTTPTMKQKNFSKAYVMKQGNGTQAIKEVYKVKNEHTAQVMATDNLSKPVVKREIAKQLNLQGVNESSISSVLMKYIERAGEQDVLRKIDPNTALKTLDMASRLLDLYPVTKTAKLTYEVKTTLLKETPKQLKDRLKELRIEEKRFTSLMD